MFVRAPKIRSAFRRFWRAREGAAAVEFGLVAVPFFLLTFGLAEVSMIGFTQTSLDFAVAETSRRIRTGETQGAGKSYSQIQTDLCDQINTFMLLTCNGNLYLDVDRYASFTDAAAGQANPIQNGQLQTGGFGYTPPVASDIVVVRAYYRWRVMTPLFQPIFQNTSGGDRVLVSTMMFRDEPF